MPHIVGDRILLREYRKEDFPFIRKWVNDERIVGALSDVFDYPHTVHATESFLNSMLDGTSSIKGFIIAHKDTEAYIGQIDLHFVDWKNRVAELGIVIGDMEMHGKGYGREAIRLLQRFVFRTLNLNRLQLQVYDYNDKAYRSYLNAGFKEEGRLRQRLFKDGQYRDVIYMGILRDEYLQFEERQLKGSTEENSTED
ncbi:GNAT family N-acetyltransferase [Paenibacillus gansuensis]|uniref:GNAT family N-acetyltransferase n=1 Tax=Paenibacillus gansuensis TaxID=306542 RepID=A0ABW5PKC2_9BACL